MKPIDLEQLKNSLVCRFGCAPQTAPDGISYGYEGSKVLRDELDEIVDRLVRSAVAEWDEHGGYPPKILDIGGGTGHRAEQFARMGADVVVTGLSDCKAEILRRNKSIGWDALRYVQQDIRHTNPEDLANDWKLIHMRRVFNWMPQDDVIKVLEFLPKITTSKTHLAACHPFWSEDTIEALEILLKRPILRDHFHNHNPETMTELLKDAGYNLLHRNETEIQGVYVCQYLAEIPQPR